MGEATLQVYTRLFILGYSIRCVVLVVFKYMIDLFKAVTSTLLTPLFLNHWFELTGSGTLTIEEFDINPKSP